MTNKTQVAELYLANLLEFNSPHNDTAANAKGWEVHALVLRVQSAETELAALRGQKPVAVVELSDSLTVAEIKGEVPRRKAVKELYENALVVGQELFTHAQPVPVVDAGIIRDANRYRFLRDGDAWGEDSDSWDPDTRTGLISSANLITLETGSFDAAIDARMAASDIPFYNPLQPFLVKPVKFPKDMQISDAIKANISSDFMDGYNVRGIMDRKAVEAAGINVLSAAPVAECPPAGI
ncbi:hypothetical protein [Serratia sp. M24T3]|uniref:hypothetical protein n=1 Tax=Serratia sp. M24T3 TaxID=932213 RepID=UPI00025B932B|nr:hypothetical protein [Serratia sp. M24T3]EIC84721.1 hypothetical protein SPM24T3_09751 [Serratia sp. M24T3]